MNHKIIIKRNRWEGGGRDELEHACILFEVWEGHNDDVQMYKDNNSLFMF